MPIKIRTWRLWIPAVLAIALRGLSSQAATPQQIDQAINRARDYLYSQQKDGLWETVPENHPALANPRGDEFEGANWGGLTAIAVHALLAAGEDSTNPKLHTAVDMLTHSPMRGCIYALCQRDQVLQLLPLTRDVRKVAQLDGYYLAQMLKSKGEATGLYYYPYGSSTDYDHSISQFGVLGMWACSDIGFEVPNGYWSLCERAWQRHQDVSGGWSYKVKGDGEEGMMTPSMTAAGVATLYITQDYIHADEGLNCVGNITNPAIGRGMKWLAEHFDMVFADHPRDRVQTYTLYGIERIGVAGGYKYIGPHDWYKEGAQWLVGHQDPDGSFFGGLFGKNHNNIPSTAFAMFFLTRGREPVAFCKAQYDVVVDGKREEARWNQRPRDIAKMTRWIEKGIERNLNWRILNLKDTPADELQDAPILYLSGDRKLELAPEDVAKLKQFVEDGGMVLGNPDGNSKIFIDSFRALGTKMFPDYEMRVLPPEHPIYTHEQFRGSEIRKKRCTVGFEQRRARTDGDPHV